MVRLPVKADQTVRAFSSLGVEAEVSIVPLPPQVLAIPDRAGAATDAEAVFEIDVEEIGETIDEKVLFCRVGPRY